MDKKQGITIGIIITLLVATGAIFDNQITDALSVLTAREQKLELVTKGDFYEVNWTKYYLKANRRAIEIKGFTYCAEDNPKTCIVFSNPTKAFYENSTGNQQLLYNAVLNRSTRSKTKMFWRGIFPNQTITYELQDDIIKETIVIKYLPPPDRMLGDSIEYGYCYFLDTNRAIRIFADGKQWHPINNPKLETASSLVFKADDSIWYLSPSDLNGQPGEYTFTSGKDFRGELCVKFIISNRNFPYVIDPTIDEPDVSTFIIGFVNGTYANVSNYTFSQEAIINGDFQQQDIENGRELCDYIVLDPDIVSMEFVSSFPPWLNLAELFTGESDVESSVNCSAQHNVLWTRTVEEEGALYRYTFQKN